MRILFVTQWFPPEPWRVHLEAAIAFRDLGHEVEVITGFPNWPLGRVYPGYRQKLYQREEIEGLQVTRLPVYANHDPKGLKRVLNLVSLSFSLMLIGPFLIRKADHIHVVQIPFLTLASKWLALLWGARVSMEIQDLWPDTLVFAGGVKPGLPLKLMSAICRTAYRACLRIRTTTKGFSGALVERGISEDSIRFIPNWIDPDVLKPLPTDLVLMQSLGATAPFRVMYAGSIGVAQRLDVVLDAADILREDRRICFIFIGDGADRERLFVKAQARCLENIIFAGSFPQEDMSRIYSVASALLIHLAASPLYAMTLPSKIGSCLSAGKPVLAGLLGEGREIIERTLAGVTFDPENAVSFVEAIRYLADMSEADRDEMGRRGRCFAETQMSAQVLAPRMQEMLEVD